MFDGGLHDVASVFCKATFSLKISVGVSSSTLLTVARLPILGATPNLVNKFFVLQAWKDSIKPIELVQQRKANRKVVNIEGIVALFIGMGNLHVRPWVGRVGNVAVDIVLRTSFIN